MIDNRKFYFRAEEPNKSCLLTMRDILLNCDPNITETRKYGMPCFCYKGKIFCYLWVDKSSNKPYFLFVEGNYLNHPDLEAGKRSRMKILKVNPNLDLPLKTIQTILFEALALYTNGTISIN